MAALPKRSSCSSTLLAFNGVVGLPAAPLTRQRSAKETITMKNNELFALKIFNIWDPVEDENFWEAIIEVPVDYSLYEFHLFIQKIINFENDHLFEFYAARNERNRKLIFSDEAGNPYDGGEFEDILLKDVYPLKGLKLYYLFDFGDNWIFEIHKLRKKAIAQEGIEYPRMVTENGSKLIQYADFEEDDDDDDDDDE